MSNIFPAQPGTFVLERDPSVVELVRTPVIGWHHVQGGVAYPVCAMNHGGLTHGKAILHPDGYVTDSIHQLVFESERSWLTYIVKAKRDEDEGEAVEPEPEVDQDEIDDEYLAPEQDDAVEPEPGIIFGTKSYKTKSFWLVSNKEGHDIGLFEVAGGEPYPNDDAVRKVTRDEFAKAKRDGVPPINPASGLVDDGEDEDDGMDLV